MRVTATLSALAMVILSMTGQALADPLFIISGKTAGGRQIEVDDALLEKIGKHTITTRIHTLEGEHQVSGVYLRDLLSYVGAKGSTLQIDALDKYSIDVPIEDADKFDVILATSLDGKQLGVRDRGPAWTIYPISLHPELDYPAYEGRSVWQVKSITVE